MKCKNGRFIYNDMNMTAYSTITERNENGMGYAGNEKIRANETNEGIKTEETKAAAIIHGRTRYRDFREGLLVRPEDMTEEQAYRWKKQILRCTREPEEMRIGHQVRRAVISDGVFGVVGVAAYFRDIAAGSFEDEGRRPAYGFVGFIWRIDSFFRPSSFPSTADFKGLAERYVVPRWEEPKNGRNAEKATLLAYKEGWGEAFTGRGLSEWLNIEEQSETESADSESAVRQALKRAVRGEKVFFCTGLPEQRPEPDFDADDGISDDRIPDHETPRHEISNHRGASPLVWAAAIAGFLCGAVILTLVFR